MSQGYLRADLALEQMEALRRENAHLRGLLLTFLQAAKEGDPVPADPNPMPRFAIVTPWRRILRPWQTR